MTLVQFLLNNWPLTGLGLLCIIGLFVIEFRRINLGIRLLPPQQAVTMMNKKNSQIIDLRSDEAYKKGYIARSKRMDCDQLNGLQKNISNPIIIISDNNASIKKAVKTLHTLGAKEVYGIEGGLDAWRKQNYPLLSDKKANE
jgi:rhodanese-related sulfurtransferase